jgi:hypothetical protein
MFFFEKKNQKTSPGRFARGSAVRPEMDLMGKSFLVLFFKKEHLSDHPRYPHPSTD